MSKPTREATLANPSKAPLPLPHFSQAIKCGGMIYCSGQSGSDPTTGKMVEGDVRARTAQILRNLSAVLEAAGSNLQNSVKVNVYMTHYEDFGIMNEAYDRFFEEPMPSRTTVAVSELPKGTDVIMDLIAHQ